MKKFLSIFIFYIPYGIVRFLTSLLPDHSFFYRIRGFFLKPFFKKSGKRIMIARGVTLIGIRNISLGDNVYLAKNVWVNGYGGLFIGNNVVVSPNVIIATSKHEYIQGVLSAKVSTYEPIYIGDNVWIASNSVVTRGVTIGKSCIVSALSLVNKSFDDNLLIGGVPAKIIKEINCEEKASK